MTSIALNSGTITAMTKLRSLFSKRTARPELTRPAETRPGQAEEIELTPELQRVLSHIQQNMTSLMAIPPADVPNHMATVDFIDAFVRQYHTSRSDAVKWLAGRLAPSTDPEAYNKIIWAIVAKLVRWAPASIEPAEGEKIAAAAIENAPLPYLKVIADPRNMYFRKNFSQYAGTGPLGFRALDAKLLGAAAVARPEVVPLIKAAIEEEFYEQNRKLL
jgi:hypothetical protein